MKVLIDTNVLLSAALFPGGIAAKAYALASATVQVAVAEYALNEMRRVAMRKFPTRVEAIEAFIGGLVSAVEIVKDSGTPSPAEKHAIRDAKDWPIWMAARQAKADILLTGDKDLLLSGLNSPAIMNPAGFIAQLG